MKTISVGILKSDYEAFRQAAKEKGRSIAQLIREAMAFYREKKLETRPRLTELPVVPGPRPLGDLPSRGEIFDEIFDDNDLS